MKKVVDMVDIQPVCFLTMKISEQQKTLIELIKKHCDKKGWCAIAELVSYSNGSHKARSSFYRSLMRLETRGFLEKYYKRTEQGLRGFVRLTEKNE